jgi:predicted amidohydrolase
VSNTPDRPKPVLGRRELLSAAVLGGAAAVAGGATARAADAPPARGASAGGAASLPVSADGKYPVVPLRKDAVRVTAVQSIIRPVRNLQNPGPEMKRNVDHMIELIDGANGFGGKQDLVCFHEQPIMGWRPWTRDEVLRVCIDVPGPETDAIGQIAKKHGCYVTFGTYARDKDWPGHVLLNGVLIGPDGKVVANHWKTNNMRGFMPGYDIFTTSIYDVLDRYREMYGEDAVLPIARTDIGNISCSITPGQPDIIRAHAMKGLELRLSSSSGGYMFEDAAAISMYNRLYTVVVNQSISPENPGMPEFSGSGDTAIIGPNGRAVSRARSANEEFITATIPMADFRRTRGAPDVPIEMIAPVYSRYTPRYGANLQADYIPKDGADASRYFASKKRW